MHLPADRASHTLEGGEVCRRRCGRTAAVGRDSGVQRARVRGRRHHRNLPAAREYRAHWFEVIVVDDETDGTSELLDQLAAHEPRVRVVHRGRNGGRGSEVRLRRRAGGARHCHSGRRACLPAQILELAGALGDADLVASGRLHEGKASSRRTLTNGWILLTRLILGFDPTGIDGIYLIRRSVLAGLPITSDTGLVNFEVLWRCTRQRRRIARHVLPIAPRRGGESKVTNLRTIARIVGEMIWLRLRG